MAALKGDPKDEGRTTFVKTQCMHCVQPACVSACLTRAMEKTPKGPVVYHEDRCMGCRYCMMACPFEIPKYQWDRPVPVVGKCIMCAGRIKEGQPTAFCCKPRLVTACQPHAGFKRRS